MTNFARAVSCRVIADARHPAVSDGRRTLTYAELWDYSGRMCTALEGLGVAPGSRVASICHNTVEIVALDLAVLRMGAVHAPMSHRLAAAEQELLVSLVEPAVLVRDGSDAGVAGVRATTVDQLGHPVRPAPHWSGVHAYVPVRASEVATILFTSGTTGTPKGASLTHANIWASCANIAVHLSLTERDTTAIYLPLFHTAGLNLQSRAVLYAGGQVIVHDGWRREEFAATLSRDVVTYAFLSPQQWAQMAADLAGSRLHFPTPVTGGAYLDDTTLEAVEDLCGTPPHFLMGMTEASPLLFHTPAREFRRHRRAIGRPTTYADIVVRPARPDTSAALHEAGEFCIRGQLVMRGYWGNPGADAEAFDADRFFHGGDVGYLDEDGYAYLLDRKKDMIRTGGENVFSVEVEAVLAQHPQIDQVAVIGVPHPRWDEAVCAVVVPVDGAQPTLESIQEHCRGKIASFKKPLVLELRNELPRSATDKVAKRELRDQIVHRTEQRPPAVNP